MPASISGIALAIGLLITWWLWHNETQNITAMFQTKFDSRVNEFERLTTNRIHDYEQVLLGMRGLFAASKEVGRGEFHDYADALNMAKNFPGANGLCFSLIVPAVKKDRHIAAIRNSGFSSYSIRPNTPRDFYTSIIFAEPFSGRNQRALGFDNFTDATRRIAMELSRDSGNMSISGKVILLHEADAEQAGIRMYLPIYKKGASALTLEDRRTNIIGWLYMPIRMDDFMRDALGLRASRLDVEIYDGDIVTPDSLMFDSDVTRSHLAEDSNSLFKTVKTISVRGHNWTLAAHSLPSFDARLSEGKQEFIIYAGTGISFLLAFLTWLFLYGRSRILVEAQSVARSEAQLSSIIENALDAVIQLDIQGRVCGWNSRAEQMFGWRRDAAHGQVFEEMAISVASRYKFRSHMEEPQAINPKYQAQFKEAKSNERSKLIALHRDGSEFPIELSLATWGTREGIFFTGIIRDVTERKKAEEALRRSRDELEIRVQERTAELANTNQALQIEIEERKQVESALRESETKYRIVADNTYDWEWWLSPEGRFVYVSSSCKEITGYDPEEFLKDPDLIFRIICAEDKPIFMNHQNEVDNNQTGGEVEFRIVRPDRSHRWIFHACQAVFDDHGNFLGHRGSNRDITERKLAQEALQQSEEQLRYLSSQLLSAEEKERKRIARELHDGIGQSLTAIKFRVENMLQQMNRSKAKRIAKPLEAIIPLIQQSIEESRRIQMDLRPSILDDLGILATLSWFCREFQITYSRISIEKLMDINEDEVPDSLKTVIYRISQEALNNVAKHSKADLVHLALRKSDGKIELAIRDNGQGFDLNQIRPRKASERGLGLTSMRERTELSGGTFEIESAPGGGTIIRASWTL